ncbi:hypothetical protein L4X63_07025 [Geomonas sp. Red32]|uniref:hypothetical protein n=1 Tax=Geomonas sp. Red32 TaxID=2912856 RepID=UPI00202CDBE5|nr:hypothetical protein [Geomonas sp. Red32]MCM0081338.1 hypothetical protein [Geomonas sp. Red32]
MNYRKSVLLLALLLLPFTGTSREACSAVTEQEVGRACVEALEEASSYYLQKIVAIRDNEGRKDLILLEAGLAGSGSTSLVALLRLPDGCRIVLSTDGRGIDAEPKKGKGYPDIHTYYFDDDDHNEAMQTKDVTYFWNGKEYEDVTLKKRTKKGKGLNQKALDLFKRGKIEEAIAIWKRIEQEPDVATAEVSNNLGFAYYTLGRKNHDTRRYSEDPGDPGPIESTPWDMAFFYLNKALEKEPNRWSALLNMADLEYEENDFVWALKQYEKLLKVKPDYVHADVIRKRIEELKGKPEKVGAEVVVMSYRTGEKDITYTRVNAQKVLRCGYYRNGKLRFRESIVDGLENGEFRSWFDDGKVSVEGQQKNGEGTGKFVYYQPDGSISQVLIHKEDGTVDDVTKEYAK